MQVFLFVEQALQPMNVFFGQHPQQEQQTAENHYECGSAEWNSRRKSCGKHRKYSTNRHHNRLGDPDGDPGDPEQEPET